MQVNPRALLEAGNALLLGWDTPEAPSAFGFGAAARQGGPARAPVLYQGDGHLMTVAPTGAGKGRGLIIPNLLTYRGPVIVVDPKGENYQVTARRRADLGQRVIVLDPFQVVTDKGDHLNPLDTFDLAGSILECDAEMLASLLSVGHRFTTDPFWNDSADGFLAGLIAHIASACPPGERTLNKLRSYFTRHLSTSKYRLPLNSWTKMTKLHDGEEPVILAA